MTSRFNLWDEPWLEVMDFHEQLHQVSLTELFEHAHQYRRISGDMATQDFAVLRNVLAILQTTFMRYRTDGSPQGKRPEELHDTWEELWKKGRFPMEAIRKYRDEWKDRFYLYDDRAPFLQLPADKLQQVVDEATKHQSAGHFLGKTIKRTISESGHKQRLFQPYTEATKNHLSNAELTRWLISLQGYAGTSDKVKAPALEEDNERATKGWLFSIGGLYLRGDDLFETLVMNLILDRPQAQHPVWEWTMADKMDEDNYVQPSDLASLYTNCSRLLHIEFTKAGMVDVRAVQLGNLDEAYEQNEPMCLWGKNKKQEIYPKLHDPSKSLWQSFGLIDDLPVKDEYRSRMPGIMRWFRYLVEHDYIDYRLTKIVAIGMTHPPKDISNSPNGEAYDELSIQNELFKPVNNERIQAIYNEVENTQRAVRQLQLFASRLEQLRNDPSVDMKYQINDVPLVADFERQAYFQIDTPFKRHIAEMSDATDLNQWIDTWRERVEQIIMRLVNEHMDPLESSDLEGVPNQQSGAMENIITLYMRLRGSLNQTLKEVEKDNE